MVLKSEVSTSCELRVRSMANHNYHATVHFFNFSVAFPSFCVTLLESVERSATAASAAWLSRSYGTGNRYVQRDRECHSRKYTTTHDDDE
jgi:hypothetical protein